ncbi:MAG: hypothetical protein JSS27_11690 [Planctomycetes bacterium]|nr:hypothetical protein [Planctomycetota bacterium]
MDISSITSRLPSLTGSGSSGNPFLNLPSIGGTPPNSATMSALGPTAKARAILAQYDIHQISPRELSEVVQKLTDAGVLSPGDAQDLTQLRLNMDSEGIQADETIDLPSFLTKQINDQSNAVEQLQSQPDSNSEMTAAKTKLDTLNRQLAWVQKFTAVQDSPAGIQAVV